MEDLKTGIKTDLKLSSSYSFTGAPGDDQNRFRLIIGSPNGIEDPAGSDFNIYTYGNTLYIRNDKVNEPYTVTVTNMLGQIISRSKQAGNRLSHIEINAIPGVYVATIVSKGLIYSKKVVIR
jgi:hypothetical protein